MSEKVLGHAQLSLFASCKYNGGGLIKRVAGFGEGVCRRDVYLNGGLVELFYLLSYFY